MKPVENSTEDLAVRMSVLYDASLLISCSENYQEMLVGITRHFGALMPIHFCWLLVHIDDQLRCVALFNDDQGVRDGNMLPFSNSLLEKILQQQLDERIDDLSEHRAQIVGDTFPDEMRSLMVCPLKRGREKIGCFVIGSKEKASYSKDHAILLFLLGFQLATVMKNIRLRNQLQSTNERLNLIFTSIDEGLMLLDADNRIIETNLPVTELFFPEESFKQGIDFFAFLESHKKRFCLGSWVHIIRTIDTRPAAEFPVSFELVEDREQEPFSMSLEFMPVADQTHGRQLFVLLRDIRERKKADELRRDLTSMLVHDLRSPLGIINWNMEMILDGVLGEVNEKQKKFLKGSIENSQELLDMIDSLLDIDRLETGNMMLDLEDINMHSLAENLVQRMEFLSHQMGISFELFFEENFPKIVGDPSLLRRVFFNLVFNASKYSSPDSKIELTGEYNKEKDEVIVGVRDYGPGIPKKYRSLIFDKYVQAQARDQGEIKSKGLGLTFCKLAVEAHGGSIWVESEEGKGSWFKFRLSCAGPEAVL